MNAHYIFSDYCSYTQKMPVLLPRNTRVILNSIYCNFWNSKGHAHLNYVTHQKDNDNVSGKAEDVNTHYNVHANTFIYKQMIPRAFGWLYNFAVK